MRTVESASSPHDARELCGDAWQRCWFYYHLLMINTQVRYSAILDRHPELFDPSISILEVGSGDHGIAQYLKRSVTGLEPRFGSVLNPWLVPAVGSILDIPFPDEHFDLVLCVDGFEHLDASVRPLALRELFRVARRKVVVSCPCDPFAAEGERHLAELFRRTPLGVPDWLQQHLQHGLPTVGSILEALIPLGVPFDIEGNEGLQQHYGGILLDHFFPYSRALLAIQHRKTQIGAPIEAGGSDLFYSYVFTAHKSSRNPVLRHGDGPAANRGSGPSPSDAPSVEGPGAGRAVDGTGASATVSTRVASERVISVAQQDVGLYCVFHRSADISHLGRVTPVFVGPAAKSAPPDAVTDIPATEPGLPNSRWSELSAMYKVWREGPRTKIVGFSHYRRLFNFRAIGAAARETRVGIDELRGLTPAFFDADVISQTGGDAIIAPPPITLNEPSVWIQYCLIHHPGDWCRILGMLSRRYPHLLRHAASHFDSPRLFANNMFVMCWDRFDELCRLWFDVLLEFEHKVSSRRGNAYQDRDVSFLAERIFDIWLKYHISQGTRLIEAPIFFVEDALPPGASESAPLPAQGGAG